MELKGGSCQQLELMLACTCTHKHMLTAGLRPTKDACLLISWGNWAFLLPGMFVTQDENSGLLCYGKLWSISNLAPVERAVPSEQVFKYWMCLINGP